MWGHQHFDNIVPDILTMAKPLANGVPIGAIMTSEKVGDLIKLGKSFHSILLICFLHYTLR
jgi:acetylornithine aminotransferase